MENDKIIAETEEKKGGQGTKQTVRMTPKRKPDMPQPDEKKSQTDTVIGGVSAKKDESAGNFETADGKGKKARSKKKKKRKGNGLAGWKIALIVVIAVVLAAAGTILTFFLMGYRFEKNTFEYKDGTVSYSVKYLGKKDSEGRMTEGKFIYDDGSRADVSLLENGLYQVCYDDGSVYVGEITNMHRNGDGTLTLKNKDKYSGSFSYDQMNGYGVYEYSNGDKYEGYFVNNVKSGNGVYEWENGDKYVGEFFGNIKNGKGTYTYSDGTVYVGNYKNDKKNDENGKLTIVYTDGTKDVYVGSFVDDVREGYGSYSWSCGDNYTGNFSANTINGKGRYTWASGRTYEGEFLAGAIVRNADIYPVH